MTREFWSWLLILLPLVGWISTMLVIRAARALPEGALVERAIVAVICSLAATLIAVLAGAFLLGILLPPGTGFSVLVGVCVLVNVPPIVWAVALLTGRLS